MASGAVENLFTHELLMAIAYAVPKAENIGLGGSEILLRDICYMMP
jgi:hypothetical protein